MIPCIFLSVTLLNISKRVNQRYLLDLRFTIFSLQASDNLIDFGTLVQMLKLIYNINDVSMYSTATALVAAICKVARIVC